MWVEVNIVTVVAIFYMKWVLAAFLSCYYISFCVYFHILKVLFWERTLSHHMLFPLSSCRSLHSEYFDPHLYQLQIHDNIDISFHLYIVF